MIGGQRSALLGSMCAAIRTTLAGSLLVILAGCGGKVVVEAGGGSSSTNASSSSSSSGSGTVVSPGCSADVPAPASACSQQGQVCTYSTGNCELTFTCEPHTTQSNSFDCGAMPLAWAGPGNSQCGGCAGASGPCVSCEMAKKGDTCDAVGYSCSDFTCGGNCMCLKVCGADHLWLTQQGQPGCCI